MNTTISVQQLNAWLKEPGCVVLMTEMANPATGENEEAPKGYIPGAIKFDFEKVFCDSESSLPHTMPSAELFTREARKLGLSNSHRIVVYDNKGIYSSARVWWMLKAMGHEQVWVLDGGFPAWIEANLDIEDSLSTPVTEGDFKASYKEHLFTDKTKLLNNLNTSNSLVMDARSAQRFYGLVDEPRRGVRSGHIPGALSLPFTELLSEGQWLKPIDALKEAFGQVEQEKPLVFSCGSGVTACILALAAAHIGARSLSVYDGSWSEWGSDESLPVSVDE